jgi:CRP-like cAMP-binding protein
MTRTQRHVSAEDLDRLRDVPVLAGLSRQALETLVHGGTVRAYDRPTTLFTTGEPATCFYVVLRGTVHLFALTPDGDQGVVTFINAGESFAEAAMFGNAVFPVTGEAQPDTEVVRIERGPFEAQLKAEPALGFQMLDAQLARQTFLMEEIVRLKAHSPGERLASYLLSLAETTEWAGRGRLPIRKQLIASRIGIEPESLSRVLRRLSHAGVACVAEDVIIEQPEKLRAYCAQFSLR